MSDISSDWEQQFGMRPDTRPVAELLGYLKQTPNPHRHGPQDLKALSESIKFTGFKNLVLLWDNPETGQPEVIYGGGRITAADSDGLTNLPVAWAVDFDKAKAKFLRVADNRVQQLASSYNEDVLLDHLLDLRQADVAYDYLKFDPKYDKAIDKWIYNAAESESQMEQYVAGQPITPITPEKLASTFKPENGSVTFQPRSAEDLARAPFLPPTMEAADVGPEDVPATVFPSDNEYEIPLLKLSMQAPAIVTPVVQWGDISRKVKMFGTYHFYVEDLKFRSLMWDLTPPLQSECQCLVEPNFSMYKDCRIGEAIGYIYFKRKIARVWQEYGKQVFVDLNVNPRFMEMNMLGVPDGWRSYFTRGYSEYPEKNIPQYEIACKKADSDDILFVVYGGGDLINGVCQEHGWTWIEDRRSMTRSEWNEKFKVENTRR